MVPSHRRLVLLVPVTALLCMAGVASAQSVSPPAAPHKSPGLAAVMSAVIPGTGQFYNGQAGKGVLHLGLAVVASGVAIAGFSSTECAGYYDSYFDTYLNSWYSRWVPGTSCAVGYGGLALAAGVRIWSLLDASRAAKRINRAASQVSLHVEPWFAEPARAPGRGVRPALRVRLEVRTLALLR